MAKKWPYAIYLPDQWRAVVPKAAVVLSGLLAQADERAGELAKAYDQARIAGQQCEQEYDALRKRK